MSRLASPQPTPLAARPEPAYGWVIVTMAAIAMTATLPGRTHGLGLATKRLLEDFATVSQEEFAFVNLWATLLGALFCLPAGWLIDRLGTRFVLTAVMAGLAATVVWMSTVQDTTSLAIAITLTRGIGQSMLSVVSITMIGKWFERRLGLAMGVYAVQMSLLMALATGLLGHRITIVGWRAGWQEMGVLLAAIAPLCLLLAKSSPAGQRLASTDAPHKHAADTPSATLVQALLSPAFWVFALSISFFGLVSSGISLFQQFILEERGLSEQVFHRVLVIGLLVGMVTNLACGYAAQHMRLQHLLATAMLLLAVSYVVLPLVRAPIHAYGYAIVQGIAGGILTVLFFAVWGHAYGPVHLGRIQGAAQMLTVLASAVGPLLVARSQAFAGSYAPVLYTFAAVAAGFSAVAFLTPVPCARRGAWPVRTSSPPLQLAPGTNE